MPQKRSSPKYDIQAINSKNPNLKYFHLQVKRLQNKSKSTGKNK